MRAWISFRSMEGWIAFATISLLTLPMARPQAPSSSPMTTAVSFVANRGQNNSWVNYVARTAEGEVAVGADRIAIAPSGSEHGSAVVLRFADARTPEIREEDPLPGLTNYYFGGATMRRIEGVPSFHAVRYVGLYPRTDVLFHGRGNSLEYDFELSPGAAPSDLKVDVGNSSTMTLQSDGSLSIEEAGNRVKLHVPQANQTIEGTTISVTVSYKILGPHRFGFSVGAYDSSRPLIIDPVVSYAGVITINNTASISDATLDSAGNQVVVGYTAATAFPTPTDWEPVTSYSGSLFVLKFDSTGTKILYTTIIADAGIMSSAPPKIRIAADGSGNVFIAGPATGSDFPVTTRTLDYCANGCMSGFIAKLGVAGNIIYSTGLSSGARVGGTVVINALAVGPDGQPAVAGSLVASILPAVNAYQSTYLGGNSHSAFFVKLNSTGTGYIFSSYLGGSFTNAEAIAFDPDGNVYIAGEAGDYQPLKGEFQSSSGSYFLDKFSPDGQTLLFGTVFGTASNGSSDGFNRIAGIAAGADGAIYIGGTSLGDNSPFSLKSFNHPLISRRDHMFAMAFEPGFTGLRYSVDLGEGEMSGMAIDPDGNFYAAGRAQHIRPLNATVADVAYGGVYFKLDQTGAPLQASTFGGQQTNEIPTSIKVDSGGNIFLAGNLGFTRSPFVYGGAGAADPIVVFTPDFPSGPIPAHGASQVFIAKISPSSAPQISLGTTVPFLPLHNAGTVDLHISNITANGATNKLGGNCGSTLAAGATCILTVTTPSGQVANASITVTSDASPAAQTFLVTTPSSLINNGNGDYLYPDSSKVWFDSQYAETVSPVHPLTLTNVGYKDMTINSIKAYLPFIETNNCPVTLAAGASCVLQVSWDTSQPTQGDTISIGFDGMPVVVADVAQIGVISETPILVTPTYVDFGDVTYGHPTFPRSIALENTTNSPIAAPTVALAGDSGISITGNTCASSIPAHQSCALGFGIDSSLPGDHTSTLTLTGTATGTYRVAGDVVQPQPIIPSAYQMKWNPVPIGQSVTQVVTLTNTALSATSIQSINFASSTNYSQTNNCTASPLGAGASCTVQLTFSPQAGGQQNGALILSVGTNNLHLLVSLTGEGIYPLAISPTLLDFGGTTPEAGISPSQTVTVTNSTSASVGYDLKVSGNFAATNQCPNPIPGSTSCSISVTFNPPSASFWSGSLSLTATGLSSAISIPLYGTGVYVPPSLTIASAAGASFSATVARGQSASYALTVSSGNTYDGLVTFSCIDAPLYATCTVAPSSLSITRNVPSAFTVTVSTQTPSNTAQLHRNIPLFPLLAGAGIILLPLSFRKRMCAFHLICAIILSASATGIISCGSGSGSSGGNGGGGNAGTSFTAPGTYNLRVIANSNQGTSVTQTITLIIQ